MADRPIIFSTPMVRALLDGRKSQTRRSLNAFGAPPLNEPFEEALRLRNKYRVGDRLWCREAHALPNDQVVIYRANWRQDALARGLDNVPATDDGIRWRPSIHMPRWASRLTLIVTDVRVQQVQEISEEDAIAEGVDAVSVADVPRQAAWSRRQDFSRLWNSINGPDAWDDNPWVAALTFSVHRANIDALPAEKRSAA